MRNSFAPLLARAFINMLIKDKTCSSSVSFNINLNVYLIIRPFQSRLENCNLKHMTTDIIT